MQAVDQLLSGDTPRADAARNVERLVAAAREAIAQGGTQVTSHEIAARAGVGVGTFYRRVASREALLTAVMAEILGDVIAEADRLLESADPWTAFAGFAHYFVRMRAASVAVSEVVMGQCGFAPADVLEDLRGRIRTLVSRAQAAGGLREDLTWQDVPFLLAGVATVSSTLGLAATERQWERNLRVVLDGMRTPARGPLPQ